MGGTLTFFLSLNTNQAKLLKMLFYLISILYGSTAIPVDRIDKIHDVNVMLNTTNLDINGMLNTTNLYINGSLEEHIPEEEEEEEELLSLASAPWTTIFSCGHRSEGDLSRSLRKFPDATGVRICSDFNNDAIVIPEKECVISHCQAVIEALNGRF